MDFIISNSTEAKLFGFTCKAYSPEENTPTTLIGRNICSLTQTEKQSMLIAKLLERIRCPSFEEVKSLNETLKIVVADGECHLVSIGRPPQTNANICFKDHVCHLLSNEAAEKKFLNLGTEKTPAFFYDKFVFVLDKNRRVFAPVELNVVFFNEKYVLMLIGDDLVIKFNIKGLRGLGNFKSVQRVLNGYLINTISRNGKEKVVLAAQKLSNQIKI